MAYPRFRRARTHTYFRRTAGDLGLTSATWANVSTEGSLSTAALDLVLPAAVGDVIEYGINGMWASEGTSGSLDVMTLVSSAGVHWFGSGELTTTTGDGVVGWYAPGGVFMPISGVMMLTVAGTDISGGTVTCRPRYRGSDGSQRSILANTSDPLLLWMKNIGPVYA